MDPVRERVLADVLAARERLLALPLGEEPPPEGLPSTAAAHLRRLAVDAVARGLLVIEGLDRVGGQIMGDENGYRKKIRPERHPEDRDWLTVVLATAGIGILVGIVLALLAWGSARGAPATRKAKPAAVDLKAALVGRWRVTWCNQPGEMTFSADGSYEHRHRTDAAKWGGTPNHYTGSWGVRKGNVLWVTESEHPEDPRSWVTYAVELKGKPLSGKCQAGQGYAGHEVRLVEMPKLGATGPRK